MKLILNHAPKRSEYNLKCLNINVKVSNTINKKAKKWCGKTLVCETKNAIQELQPMAQNLSLKLNNWGYN